MNTSDVGRRGRDALLSVVVPVHDEADGIAGFLAALQQTLEGLDLRWEILVVDDGSQDGSAAVALAAGRSAALRVVTLSRNFGKEAALTAGFAMARGDAVATIDADFQHPPATLVEFVARWREGYDMVYGVRAEPLDEPLAKRVLRKAFHRWVGRDDLIVLPPGAGDFRLLDRKAVDALGRFSERERMMKGLFALLGFRQVAVPYHEGRRAAGRSSFGLRRVARLAATGVTSFSALPLQAFGVAGVVVSATAFAYAAWIVLETLVYGQHVDGFATLAAGILIFGGLQMLSVAVLGAYVSRIYREVKGRPTFIVDRIDEATGDTTSGPGAARIGSNAQAQTGGEGDDAPRATFTVTRRSLP
ncbi:MAG: glycosyltransferase family 2 protein [Burkholderiales bacterium]|nr:glycosyltransferase family 2 protein [Burkholderiales bacterium]